jgi:hypothetical protein
MLKRIFISGLLGGIVLILWALVTNVFFSFKSRIDMRPITNESQVYRVLKENIVEPGGYMFAVFSDLAKFGIGGYPLRSVLLLAANDFISWTLAGLVVARFIRPEPTVVIPA